MVWNGPKLRKADNWIARLSDGDVAEILTAVEATKSSSNPLEELTRDDFKLGSVGRRLLALRDEVLEGRGFAVIRGLPGDEWSNEDLVRAYWGMGLWLGDAVSQNAKAHLLGHIIDQRLARAAETRIYQTNRALPFHSDSCDITGLLFLHVAKSGGASSIASAPAIHNDMLDNTPALLDTLYGVFQCDRWGEIPEGKLPCYSARVFNDINGKFVCCGMDPDIRSAQRLAQVVPLTSEQIDALDTFQSTAGKLALDMTLERGDIQLVNNHTVVHARTAFQDFDNLDRRRYLVRLWLSSRLGRTLPDFMVERWGNIEPGTVRGGILVPGASPTVQLDPNA